MTGDVYLVAGNGSLQLLVINKQMVTYSVLSNKFRHVLYATVDRQWTMMIFTSNECPCFVGHVRSEPSHCVTVYPENRCWKTDSRQSWSTVSKAELKANKTRGTSCSLSTARTMSLYTINWTAGSLGRMAIQRLPGWKQAVLITVVDNDKALHDELRPQSCWFAK